jgi:LacI family transcriptional regulator
VEEVGTKMFLSDRECGGTRRATEQERGKSRQAGGNQGLRVENGHWTKTFLSSIPLTARPSFPAPLMSIVRLAKDLGLSISTVSRALNGYDDVSAATRERVAARAKSIGYRPNPSARRLGSGKTSAIGVILPAAGSTGQAVDSMYSSLLGGVATEIEPAGYHLLASMQTRPDPAREAALYDNFIRGGWVDALLIVRTRAHDSRLRLAREARIPFVTYGRTESAEPYAWVDTDNEKAFHLATTRLLDFGHRRIALINGPAEYYFAQLRERGYRRAFADRKLKPDPAWVLHGDVTEGAGHALCRSLLIRNPAPTAFVCATDTMAFGAIAACREAGLAVGPDVSVIGYGNSSLSAFCDPPLTTVEHQVFENGRHVGQALIRLLRGEIKPADVHYLEPVVLVPRKSDGPVPRKK